MCNNVLLNHNCSKRDASLTFIQDESYLTCLPLMLIKMKKSDISALVSSKMKDIFGRGKRQLPNSSDEKELRTAIKRLKLSYPNSVRKRQRLIPFVYDTPDYVHVLTRRTDYLLKNDTVFIRVPFKSMCTNHSAQNLDLEISQLTTF